MLDGFCIASYFIGALIVMYGVVIIIIAGFSKHWLWGAGMLLVPFVWIVFFVKYPESARRPARCMAVGGVVIIATCITAALCAR